MLQVLSKSNSMEKKGVTSSKNCETELLSKKIEFGAKKRKRPEFGLIKKSLRKRKKIFEKDPKASKDESCSSSAEPVNKQTATEIPDIKKDNCEQSTYQAKGEANLSFFQGSLVIVGLLAFFSIAFIGADKDSLEMD